MSPEQLFDTVGVRFDPERFGPGDAVISWHFTDLDEHHALGFARSAIHHTPGAAPESAVSVALDRRAFSAMVNDPHKVDDLIAEGQIVLDGEAEAFHRFAGSIETFSTPNIIEP